MENDKGHTLYSGLMFVYMCVHTGGRGQPQVLFLGTHPSSSLGQGLLLAWSLLIWLAWLTSVPQGLAGICWICSCIPSTGI